MNMPMPTPLLLRQSPSQRFSVPPMLRRALLCCVAALAAALSLWMLAAAGRAEAETRRRGAQADAQKISAQLSAARETESARVARAKRFARMKAALENAPAEKPEWERLAAQLSAHPHIAEPTLDAPPAQPAFPSPENTPVITVQRVRFNAGLLHEEALLALDAITARFTPRLIPAGCSLQREADAAPITLRANCEFERIALAPPSVDAR
ncbi:MAG: hypothetical protein LBU76_07115 [Azoarcus sp.]|jgi:hypothetical protein|nr:hypothetical protein [Azoarcus sp.]